MRASWGGGRALQGVRLLRWGMGCFVAFDPGRCTSPAHSWHEGGHADIWGMGSGVVVS